MSELEGEEAAFLLPFWRCEKSTRQLKNQRAGCSCPVRREGASPHPVPPALRLRVCRVFSCLVYSLFSRNHGKCLHPPVCTFARRT